MSCLFRSLSFFIRDMNESSLRQVICDYLATHPTTLVDGLPFQELVSTAESCDPSTYILRMRQEETWGGGIEIKAFCELFRVAVDVHVRSSNTHILFTPSDTTIPPTRVRIEWTGNHYEPLSSS